MNEFTVLRTRTLLLFTQEVTSWQRRCLIDHSSQQYPLCSYILTGKMDKTIVLLYERTLGSFTTTRPTLVAVAVSGYSPGPSFSWTLYPAQRQQIRRWDRKLWILSWWSVEKRKQRCTTSSPVCLCTTSDLAYEDSGFACFAHRRVQYPSDILR